MLAKDFEREFTNDQRTERLSRSEVQRLIKKAHDLGLIPRHLAPSAKRPWRSQLETVSRVLFDREVEEGQGGPMLEFSTWLENSLKVRGGSVTRQLAYIHTMLPRS